jgi:uncharacterized protein YjbI with pentapeptide repeats
VRSHLDGALLFGAELDGAHLDGASLAGAQASESTKWPKEFKPKDAGVIIDN